MSHKYPSETLKKSVSRKDPFSEMCGITGRGLKNGSGLIRTNTRTTPPVKYLRTFFCGRAAYWSNGQERAICCPNVQGLNRAMSKASSRQMRAKQAKARITRSYDQLKA